MKDKGITLVALVITIIVMLILVGVVVTVSIGESGLIRKAKLAASDTQGAKERELNYSNEQSSIIDSIVSSAGSQANTNFGGQTNTNSGGQTNTVKTATFIITDEYFLTGGSPIVCTKGEEIVETWDTAGTYYVEFSSSNRLGAINASHSSKGVSFAFPWNTQIYLPLNAQTSFTDFPIQDFTLTIDVSDTEYYAAVISGGIDYFNGYYYVPSIGEHSHMVPSSGETMYFDANSYITIPSSSTPVVCSCNDSNNTTQTFNPEDTERNFNIPWENNITITLSNE